MKNERCAYEAGGWRCQWIAGHVGDHTMTSDHSEADPRDATIARLTAELAEVKHTASIMAKEANRGSAYVFSLLAQSTAECDSLAAFLEAMTAKRDEVADEMIRARNECHDLRVELSELRATVEKAVALINRTQTAWKPSVQKSHGSGPGKRATLQDLLAILAPEGERE